MSNRQYRQTWGFRGDSATAWHVEYRPDSGLFIRRAGGNLLAKIGTGTNPSILLYDHRDKGYTEIDILALSAVAQFISR